MNGMGGRHSPKLVVIVTSTLYCCVLDAWTLFINYGRSVSSLYSVIRAVVGGHFESTSLTLNVASRRAASTISSPEEPASQQPKLMMITQYNSHKHDQVSYPKLSKFIRKCFTFMFISENVRFSMSCGKRSGVCNQQLCAVCTIDTNTAAH